jgi:hypothetical protein
MKISFSMVILLSIVLALSCTHRKAYNGLQAIKVNYTYPMELLGGRADSNSLFYHVYYKDKLVMYEFNYSLDSFNNGKHVLHERRTAFFVTHTDSLYGYCYDAKTRDRNNKRLLKDSLLKTFTLENNKLDSFVFKKPDSIFFTSASSAFTEYFKVDGCGALSNCMTIQLTFDSKYNKYRESFSRKLDSAKGKKLVKVHIGFNDTWKGNGELPAQKEAVYQMDELKMENTEKIVQLFDRYQKDSGNSWYQ